jgi:hypothetical protein
MVSESESSKTLFGNVGVLVFDVEYVSLGLVGL